MRLLTVTDSDIIEAIGFESVEHDPTQAQRMLGTLEIVFKSSPNDVYQYKDVQFEHFVKLIGADSIGKMFHELFRKTKYPFTKSARPPTLKK